MAHEIAFYPVGNGDTTQVILDNGKRLLFDFCHRKKGEDEDDPLIDLKKILREELTEAKRKDFDVVCFTHADADHIAGSTDFFELQHADKYCGKDRIKILELWVPASMILEEGAEGEDRVLRQEARHRLKEGKGILVFSKPEILKDWMADNKIDFEKRKHLFVDAGQVVDRFALDKDGLEVFCHSPFIEHAHEGDAIRNEGSIIVQLTFEIDGSKAKFLEVGDTDHTCLAQIVRITNAHKRAERLEWDIFNIPHHCSYKALGEEKGKSQTKPDDDVAKLLLAGQEGAYIVSSSLPIDDTPAAYEQKEPPHIQAKNTYKEYLSKVKGREFLVTMEHKSRKRPEPIRFVIEGGGISKKALTKSALSAVYVSTPPRAGESVVGVF